MNKSRGLPYQSAQPAMPENPPPHDPRHRQSHQVPHPVPKRTGNGSIYPPLPAETGVRSSGARDPRAPSEPPAITQRPTQRAQPIVPDQSTAERQAQQAEDRSSERAMALTTERLEHRSSRQSEHRSWPPTATGQSRNDTEVWGGSIRQAEMRGGSAAQGPVGVVGFDANMTPARPSVIPPEQVDLMARERTMQTVRRVSEPDPHRSRTPQSTAPPAPQPTQAQHTRQQQPQPLTTWPEPSRTAQSTQRPETAHQPPSQGAHPPPQQQEEPSQRITLRLNRPQPSERPEDPAQEQPPRPTPASPEASEPRPPSRPQS